jgi:hypothetical protein
VSGLGLIGWRCEEVTQEQGWGLTGGCLCGRVRTVGLIGRMEVCRGSVRGRGCDDGEL